MQPSRLRTNFRRLATAAPLAVTVALLGPLVVPTSTQTAVANGDTRTLTLHHAHRKDTITVTFRRNGSYDSAALDQLNFFLRDWRNDQQVRMDPRLFDVIWEAQRGAGSSSTVLVLSAYRSPVTNAMLRSRSRAVAKESQHMHGKAMDFRLSDVNMHRVREVALRMQQGGVGWYGSSNFVHLDVGSVRAWPRLSYDTLARLFPDGKTVHISADGRVLPGYEEARALVASRGGAYVPTLAQVKEKSFLARLFGLDEDDEEVRPAARGRGRAVASAAPQAVAVASADDSSPASFFRRDAALRSGDAPAQVAAVAPAARPEPAREAPRPEPAREPARAAEPAKEPIREPARLAEPARRQVEEPAVDAPLPPRRPSPAQIAAIIQRAADASPAGVPMPPQRPESLTVVAEAARAAPQPPEPVRAALNPSSPFPPLPPLRSTTQPARAAAAAASALPPVITQGAPGAGQAGAQAPAQATSLMAYAPTIQPQGGNETIRRVAPRKPDAGRPAPVLARTVGVRAGKSVETAVLVAARLDRSNFVGLTDGRSLSAQPASSLMGSTVSPLRAAAKNDPSRLMFAPADAPSYGFTANANPTQADRFAQPVQQQASRAASDSRPN